MESQQAMGQAECPAPSLCVSAQGRVEVPKCMWVCLCGPVPGHVIVCICLWFLNPGLCLSGKIRIYSVYLCACESK